jgi:hypothetical protein
VNLWAVASPADDPFQDPQWMPETMDNTSLRRARFSCTM